MKTVIIKMTDAYEHQSFYKNINDLEVLDLRSIEGTRCYCDDVAKAELEAAIHHLDYSGIHFIDSGNYHYLSLLWLEKIDRDFSLVLFDHHSDDQPPSFGDILSCGGWVLYAKETLPHLKEVYTFGVGQEIPADMINTDYPLFISIDKDVLCQDVSLTDWDQGDMTLEEMHSTLSVLIKDHEILGVDISGDSGEFAETASAVNNQTNTNLFDFLSANL